MNLSIYTGSAPSSQILLPFLKHRIFGRSYTGDKKTEESSMEVNQ